jgi:hypothetical protein
MRNRFVVGFFLLSAMIVSGQTVAYDATVQPGNQAWTGNLGLDFDVTTRPIIVTALGAFDNNGDGFSGTVSVQIFNRDTQAPIGPSVSLSGAAAPLVNGDRFMSVPAFQLPVGHYSVVAVGFNATDLNGNTGCVGNGSATCVGANPFTASAENGSGLITFLAPGRYDANTSLDFPLLADTSALTNPYLAGTFQFQGYAAPLVSKSFPTTFGTDINLGQTTQVIITLTNPNPLPLSSLNLVDVLPQGLIPGNPLNFGYTCAPAAGNSITNSGAVIITGSIAGNTTCTLRFDVVATEAGPQTNTILPVTTAEALPSNPAWATVYVQWWWWWFFF